MADGFYNSLICPAYGKKMTETPISFEQSLQRLEAIVEAMEKGEIPLEAAIALYKEGVELSRQCGEILSRFEAEVTLLKKESDGNFSEQKYENQ